MTTLTKNIYRAMRIRHILTWCKDWSSPREGLIDLLTDARHWCDSYAESFARLDQLAYEHYLAERAEPQNTGTTVNDPITGPCAPRGDMDVHGLLKERRQIAAIWSVEDVQAVRPDLTDDQAWQVIQEVGRLHDAEYGINWTTLECMAEMLFDPNPKTDSEEEA